MAVVIAVPAETLAGERRFALTPDVVKRLRQMKAEVRLQTGGAASAHFRDGDFADTQFAATAAQLYSGADIVLKVQPPSMEEAAQLPEGSILISFLSPGRQPELAKILRDRKVTSLAMELVPRITRAQAMDALSSQASVAGYQAALMAAQLCPKFFPMLTTAAGTIRPARALVIGAGVAGLQAIATCRRLGAIVEAYDVRAAAKEQVESLGAKFVSAVTGAEGTGGYARELTEEEKRQQQEKLSQVVAAADAVISTAAIPGRPAPKIISAEMVKRRKPGAVIIDLAAESGGNCELTQPGKTIVEHGVTIHGPLNVPSTMPVHASEMYAKNLLSLLGLMIDKEGALKPDWNDEVLKGSLYTHAGAIVHEATRKAVEGA
jgi:H+-translocating NAD(P) transhydrogenase subunit alpha